MQDVEVGAIVPSTRDLLQVVGTRRRSLALVALLPGERPAEEAARLAELNVSAFAGVEPGPAMELAARATKTVPSLCLATATDREHLLAARKAGADGVLRRRVHAARRVGFASPRRRAPCACSRSRS